MTVLFSTQLLYSSLLRLIERLANPEKARVASSHQAGRNNSLK